MSSFLSRVSRLFLVLFIVVALGAVYSSDAQSTPLTQVARTLDGQISIRLPSGWQSRDAAASVLTSVLTFGDNADSLQAIVDSLRGSASRTGVGMNGAIGILNPQLIAGLSTDLAISTMLNAMISDAQLAGARVIEQQSILIGGLYPGSIAVVSASTAKGIIGVFQAGANIVEFQIGAAPERNFDANRQMFIDMMNSIRLPAETGSPLPPTAAIATAIPVQVNPVEIQGAVVASARGMFSFLLPEGWSHQALTMAGFGDVTVLGSDTTAMNAVVSLIINQQEPDAFEGVAGLIGMVDLTQLVGQSLDSLVTPLMQEMMTSIQSPGVQVTQPPQAHTFGGQYAGELAVTNIGYIGVMRSDRQLLVVLMLSSDVDADSDVINAMLESIRIPAAAGEQPVIVPTQPVPMTETAVVRSGDLRVSLHMSPAWVLLDYVADANILAFGDSDAAAQSRLFSAKPDLATETAITGNGGLIILYPMSQFGIDPANPDLSALMTRALGNLPGYTVEQAAAPLEGIPNALYAIISGTEHGYLALLPFDDQIAYVTATGTQNTFAASADLLLAIVESVRVPAELEPTPAPTAAGLGGLGGLDAEATPEVTPEATAAGLSGL